MVLDEIKSAIANQKAISIWRMPVDEDSTKTRKLSYLIGKSYQTIERTDFDLLSSGFLFAPFKRDQEKIFINGEIASADIDMLADDDLYVSDFSEAYTTNDHVSITPEEEFKKIVSNSIKEMKSGAFQKVVLSKNHRLSLSDGKNLTEVLLDLMHKYPRALVSLVAIPKVGIWIGASPEILIEVRNNTEFHTVALAGTQVNDQSLTEGEVAWRQKEIEEQALVSRYLIDCFKKIRLREYREFGPKTVKAGNLFHLKSDFYVDMKDTNFSQLPTVMLDLLHPTSAVCGMPLEETEKFILRNEYHDRSFFSGYLGPVDISQGNIDLYVNLRCVRLHRTFAELFAGAGITKDSDPDKEWIETEHKMAIIREILTKA